MGNEGSLKSKNLKSSSFGDVSGSGVDDNDICKLQENEINLINKVKTHQQTVDVLTIQNESLKNQCNMLEDQLKKMKSEKIDLEKSFADLIKQHLSLVNEVNY